MEEFQLKHIVLSPSYPQNTTEFVSVWVEEFTDWFRNNSVYHSIFLEHPETNAHLDINIWYRKSQRWDNYSRGLKKIVKKFIEANPASEYQNFYRVSKVPPTHDDTLYLIGYNCKEERGISNIPEDLRKHGIEYYEENKKTKKVREFMNTNPLNTKNVVAYLLEQSQERNLTHAPTLVRDMIKSGFSFVALSKQHMRKALIEFKLRSTTTDLEKSEQAEFEINFGTLQENPDYFQTQVTLSRIKETISKYDHDPEKCLNIIKNEIF